MKVFSAQALIALLFAVGIEQVLALPTNYSDLDGSEYAPVEESLVARKAGDASDPIVKDLRVTGSADGLAELIEADCHAHLCGSKPVLLYDSALSKRAQG